MEKEKNEPRKVSRREFLIGAGTVAAGATLAGITAPLGCAGKSTTETVLTTTTVTPAPTAVTLSVANPSGSLNITQLFAPRLSTLAGKTVGMVINGAWGSSVMFPVLKGWLQSAYPQTTFIDYTQFPSAGTAINPALTAAVKAAKCDAVILGNAG